MLKKMAFVAAIACSVAACTPDSRQTSTVSGGELVYDTLSVDIDFPYLPFYYKMAHYRKGDTLFWAGYNHQLHSVEVFDLTNRCVAGSFPLEPEGPNAILLNQVGGLLLNDSLFVFRGYQNDIKLLSRKDRKLHRTLVPVRPDGEYRLHPRGSTNGQYTGCFGIRWQEDGKLLVPLFRREQTMEDSLALSVDLSGRLVELLPLSFPEEMRDDLSNYGVLTSPSLAVAGERVIFSFPYASRVYVWSPESGEVHAVPMDSRATPNQAEPKDSHLNLKDIRKNFEYDSVTLRFGEVCYDPASDTYLRVHYAERENLMDRNAPSYLVVHKGNTGTTVEYELPSHFSTRYFVSGGMLYFQLEDQPDECLAFAVVNVGEL